MSNPLEGCITPDNGLYNLGWYLCWNPDDDTACLDGYFSSEDLIAIAEHMKNHFKSGAEAKEQTE